MTFDAFISYSHGGDAQVAEALERGLKRFAKPWYRRRALQVFRDSSSLSANPGLWTAITEAMDDSEYLLVCCSPESAASPWVGREIEHWIQSKGEGRIILALTAGELVWSDEAGGFDLARSTAVPAALAGAFVEEPLFVDMRWARNDDQLTLRNPRFKDQIADLAAPMHGVGKDALVGEEIRQHRRTLRVAAFAAAGLIVLSGATVVSAVVAQHRADEVVRLNGDVAAKKRDIDAKTKQLRGLDDRLGRARDDLTGARSDLSQTQDDNASLQGQVDDKTTLAEVAQKRADLLKGQADQSLLAASEADHSRDLALADKNAADRLAQTAGEAAKDAQARANAAKFAEQQARNQQAEAEKERKQAILDAAGARKREDAANAAAGAAAIDARQTRLGTAATSPDVLAGSLDLALLLGNESTAVGASGNAANPTAATATLPNAVARRALLSTVESSAHALGFLHFGADAPQEIGSIAVSPDGRWVAAVEDSTRIQQGQADARLFVWGPGPTSRPAIVLTKSLGCAFDVQWTAQNRLVTVDSRIDRVHPFGCLNPRVDYTLAGVIRYMGTRVLVWDPTHPHAPAVDVLNGHHAYSLQFRSPIALTPNRESVVISEKSSFVFGNGQPRVETVVLGGAGLIKDAFFGDVGALTGGPTLSKSGRYVMGYDENLGVAGTPALWDLSTYKAAQDCDANNANESAGCYAEVTPVVDGTNDPGRLFSIGIELSPDEQHFWLGLIRPKVHNSDPTEIDVAVFDTNTRRQVGQTISVSAPYEIRDVALGNDWIEISKQDPAISDATPIVSIFDWNTLAATEVTPSGAVPGCGAEGEFAPDGDRLFLGWVCPHSFDNHTTVVSRAQSVIAQLEGLVTASTDPRRVVSQRIELTDSSIRSTLQIWDLSQGYGKLIDSRADESAVASPDGTVIVGYGLRFPGKVDRPAEMWTTHDESVQSLAGSRGVRTVAFAGGHTFVGAGTLTAGIVWNADHEPYDVLYDDEAFGPPPACSSEFGDNRLRSAVSGDGTRRAVTRDGKTVAIVRLSDAHVTQTFDLSTDVGSGFIGDLAFSRGAGRQLLVNVEDRDPNAAQRCRFGKERGSVVVQLVGPPGDEKLRTEEAVTTTGDGTRVLFASLDNRVVEVRDLTTLHLVGGPFSTTALPGGTANAHYTLNHDGTRIAATNPSGNAIVWAVDGTVVVPASKLAPGPVQPGRNVNLIGIAFRPDGKQLAVKTVDGRLFVHDLTLPGLHRVRDLPNDVAARVAYSPDGRIIAVDPTYLFDSESLDQIGPRLFPTEWSDSIRDAGTVATRFVVNGDALYLISERDLDTAAVRWRIDLPGLREQACALARRNFTRTEFDQYGIGSVYGPRPCGPSPAPG